MTDEGFTPGDAREEQIRAMKQTVDGMLTVWCMGLSQEGRDAITPEKLDKLRDGFVEICTEMTHLEYARRYLLRELRADFGEPGHMLMVKFRREVECTPDEARYALQCAMRELIDEGKARDVADGWRLKN